MDFNEYLKEFEKFAEEKGLNTEEEFNEAFNEFMKKQKIIPFDMPDFDDEDCEDAYDYLEMAQNAATSRQALKYAKKALELEPDNFDAQVAVLELSSDTSEKIIKGYKKLIADADRKMKADGWFSDEYIGDFWGVFETRPYMRLRAHYIDKLINYTMLGTAAEQCRDLLRLSSNDNLGMRYRLMHLLAYFEDEEGAIELLNKYNEKSTMFLLPLSVLYYKLGKFTEAAKYLRELSRKNKETLRFFELMDGDEFTDELDDLDNSFGYRPFTMEEFAAEISENAYFFISVQEYFSWGLKKLKTSNKK